MNGRAGGGEGHRSCGERPTPESAQVRGEFEPALIWRTDDQSCLALPIFLDSSHQQRAYISSLMHSHQPIQTAPQLMLPPRAPSFPVLPPNTTRHHPSYNCHACSGVHSHRDRHTHLRSVNQPRHLSTRVGLPPAYGGTQVPWRAYMCVISKESE